MKNILLLEDDIIQANYLKKLLVNYSHEIRVACATSLAQAKELLTSNIIFDAFFLDISLNEAASDQAGLEFATKLQQTPHYQKTPVLFITAFPEHIYSAINKLHCYAYIVKPYSEKEVYQQLANLFKKQNTLLIKTTNGIHIRLALDTLQYIQSKGRYLTFITDTTSYRSRQYTLKKLLELLPNEFVRCHKSYIINQMYVDNFDFINHYAHMNINHKIIPLSRDFHL